MNIPSYYKRISYDITGACYNVGKKLGCGFLEKVYEKALCYELEKRGLHPEPQKQIRIMYDGVDLGLDYFADIIVDDKVILELKAVKDIEDIHRAQIINYLKATGIEFGLLINFGAKSVQIERFGNFKDYISDIL